LTSNIQESQIVVRFRCIENRDELEETFRLRFKVYCQEKNWLAPSRFPDELEHDLFDSHAEHIIALNSQQEIVGTLRLIRPRSSDGYLPIHSVKGVSLRDIQHQNIAQLSRLVLDPEYRIEPVLLGLLRYVFHYTQEHHILVLVFNCPAHFCCLLNKSGLSFIELAPNTLINGRDSTPVLCELSTVLDSIRLTDPHLARWLNDSPEMIKDPTDRVLQTRESLINNL
jgi:N-acyl-L-homoserine lactone synthetase